MSEAYASGANLSLTYAYNDIDQLTSMTDGTNTITSYTYVGLRRKKTTYGNNATRTDYFTGFRNEIESVRHETSTPATIVRLDYAYNKVHDRLYERYGASGSSGDAFEYDKLRRLTKAWMGSTNPASPSGNAYVKTIDYNYDDDGNRTSVVTTPYQQTASTTSYTTNNLNEYTAVGGTTHVWDANGNLTDNGTLKFEYNYKNLIVKVRQKSDNSLIATYKYDAEGRRVEKDVDSTVERFIRSRIRETSSDSLPGGGGRYEMSHVIAVYDGSNNWLQNFTWSDRVDDVTMLEQKDILDYDTDGNTTEPTRSYYHANALGSVMEITDANEATVVSYRYDPYGAVTITRGGSPQSTDPLGQHWVFTGRYADEESGLHYYRARYYDAALGRFLQRDPLAYRVGPNLFEYVRSNAVNITDPTGLKNYDYRTMAWGDWAKNRPRRDSACKFIDEIQELLDRIKNKLRQIDERRDDPHIIAYKRQAARHWSMSELLYLRELLAWQVFRIKWALDLPANVGDPKDDEFRNEVINDAENSAHEPLAEVAHRDPNL